MVLYFVLFAIIAFFSMVECCISLKRKDSICISVIISLVFFTLSWLRWNRGTDWDSYYWLFNEAALDFGTVTNSGYEWGFSVINYYIRSFTDNYSVYLFIIATIFYSVVTFSICASSRRPITSILVMYCINIGFIFLTRQYVAIGMTMLAFYFITKKNKLGFIIALALASLFHYSSLIFIPAYWLFYLKFNNRTFILVFLSMFFLIFIMNKMILTLLSNVPGIIGIKIAGYFESDGEFEGFGQSIYRIIAGGIINRGIPLFLALALFARTRLNSVYVNGVINLYSMNFILFMIMAPIAVPLTRIAAYYEVMLFFMAPLFFDLFKKEGTIVIFIVFLLYMAYRLFIGGLNGPYGELYVPYNSIL